MKDVTLQRVRELHLGVGVVAVGGEVRATQGFGEVLGMVAEPVPFAVARGARLRLGPVPGPELAPAPLRPWPPSFAWPPGW